VNSTNRSAKGRETAEAHLLEANFSLKVGETGKRKIELSNLQSSKEVVTSKSEQCSFASEGPSVIQKKGLLEH
jgi:hypothetical protein